MRSVLYRFPDLAQLESVFMSAEPASESMEAEIELGLPVGESAEDGEWVLAIFELGAGRRATSVAGRTVVSPEGARLVFEPRDWRKLAQFAAVEARRPGSMPDIEGQAPRQDARSEPPRAPPPPATRASTRITQRPQGKGARVLMVDDDPDIRDVVSAMLEAVDLVVTPVSSAEEALARVRVERFDLLVLDWNLPKMTGVELCRLLRGEPGLSEIPVLFLTANASSQDMVEAFASGADDYVVKPFRAPELGARIFSLLRRVRRGGS